MLLAYTNRLYMSISFEQIPEAIGKLFNRLDDIEALIKEKSTPREPEVFLDVNEAGELLRLSTQSVYGLVHRREIPHNKKGNRLYFKKSELEQWMQEGRRKTLHEIKETA